MYEILIKKIIDMKLTLKDRVLILNNVLPMYDNRKNIGLKISISGKVQLLDSERKEVVMTPVGNGEYEISFKTVDAMTGVKSFDFTDDELWYLKQRVDYLDRQGMFSAAPWYALGAGGVIVLLVFGVGLVGQGLQSQDRGVG